MECDYWRPAVGLLLHQQVHRLPVQFGTQFEVLLLTFQAVYGTGPAYLRIRLLLCNPAHSLPLVIWRTLLDVLPLKSSWGEGGCTCSVEFSPLLSQEPLRS